LLHSLFVEQGLIIQEIYPTAYNNYYNNYHTNNFSLLFIAPSPVNLTHAVFPINAYIVSLKWSATSDIEGPVLYNVTVKYTDEAEVITTEEYQTNMTELNITSRINNIMYDINVTAVMCNGTLSSESPHYTVNVTGESLDLDPDCTKKKGSLWLCFSSVAVVIITETVAVIFGGGLILYRPENVTIWLNARCWKWLWHRLMTLIAMKTIRKEGEHGPRAIAVKGNEVFVCFKQHHQVKVYTWGPNERKPTLKRKINLKSRYKWDMIIDNPRGMVIDENGKIIISDSYTHKLYMFDKNGVFLGDIGGCGEKIGKLHNPKGIAEINNHILVCDLFNQRVHVFKFDETGFEPVNVIRRPQESNIWPCHIACGKNFDNNAYLYITGTNRIYVCQLSGAIENPKVVLKCTITKYKTSDGIGHKFHRIGGIAVEEDRMKGKATLVVTETFRNTVLVLKLTFDENRYNIPELIDGHPGDDTKEYEETEIFHIDFFSKQGSNKDNVNSMLKKPHPVVLLEKGYITSTDDKDECFLKRNDLEKSG
jgi:hypothetical protein